MRNLKKILALVLALIMSLSLMATAGAGSFQDVTDDNPYKTAIDVLDELKVFQGFEDGSFKPTDTLNRAQAAVLVYRIATGDVENKYLDNYTYMAQSKFNDLEGYNWAKGYINYCQNAGIVVGTSATTFNPGAPVTGYQLLVMVLRTLGYGKAGEFTDPKGWELQTASIAEREGILKNVTGGDFGAPAPRQMVAEILFRGILHDTVEYSPLTPGGYTNSGESLGKKTLGLEDIKGVVMANEWADLESGSVLAEGKTRLDVDGKTYNLDISSELTDIGELRHAYVQNGTKVLTSLEDAGGNTVKDSKDLERRGEGIKVDKLRGDVKLDDETKFFINFNDAADFVSEWRLEWSVTFDTRKTGTNEGEKLFDSEYIDISKNEAALGVTRDTSVANKVTYAKVIRRGTTISSLDIDVMRGIFSAADSVEGASSLGIDGYVFAGSNSNSNVDRNKDLSDEMTWRTFYNEYILNNKLTINDSDNGEWLKVIDNDGDGVAEYVFRTDFTMTTITDWVAKTEKWDFESKNDVENGDIKLVEGTSELAVGDVILYTWIDGVCHVSKPEPVEMTVAKKGIDYKNKTLTGTDETVYDWSGIERKADNLYDDVSFAVAGVTYDLYQDYFGFTRLYKESDGGLVLLTDGYFETDRRNDLYKAQIWNGEFTDVDVVDGADDFISDAVNKESGNVTIGNFTGNSDDEGTWKRLYRFNATYYKDPGFTQHSWIIGDPVIQTKNDIPADEDHYSYNTNIASYMVDADGAYSLSLARDHRENARTHFNSFAIDVTNYEVKAKNQVLWGIETVDANGKIDDVQRINTTTETVYYLVEGTDKDMEVTTWTGYNNAPSNYTVERAYAVTSYVADKDNWDNELPYEVAEVVVIEATKNTGVPNAYLGVSLEQRLFGNNQIGLNGLGYHPDTESWGLDTETMRPSSDDNSTLALQIGGTSWPNDTKDMMNFYYNDGGYARRIVKNFDYYRIYAGYVVTSPYVEGRNYIQITKDGTKNAAQSNSFFFPHDLETAYTVSYDEWDSGSVRTQYDVDYTHDFDLGDQVVYMVDADGNVGFVVNVTDSTWIDSNDDEVIVPGLSGLWDEIKEDYNGPTAAPSATVGGVTVNLNGTDTSVSYAIAKTAPAIKVTGGEIVSGAKSINAEDGPFTGIIKGNNGEYYNFKITVDAASAVTLLKSETNHDTCGLEVPDTSWPIAEYMNTHAPKVSTATATAVIVTNAGSQYVAEFANGEWDMSELVAGGITDTSTIANITISVLAEDGVTGGRHEAERTGTDIVNYVNEWNAVVDLLTWKLPGVGDSKIADRTEFSGPTLLSLVDVNSGFASINAATTQTAQKAAYDSALAKLKTDIPKAIRSYVDDTLLGGKVTGGESTTPADISFSRWCPTLSTRYGDFNTALTACSTVDTFESVTESVYKIVVHLDYVYGLSAGNDTFDNNHAD